MLTVSPFGILRRNIAATMAKLGLTHADEPAFLAWLYTAWLDSGCVRDFCVLKSNASYLTMEFGVRVAASGHKVNVWWGDGATGSYSPTSSTDTQVTRTFASGAVRPVVVLGRITRFESALSGNRSDFGGDITWLRSLTYLSWGGNNTGSGSVAGMLLTYLIWGGNNTGTGWGDVAASATGLCYFQHGGLTVLGAAEVNAILAGFWANRDAAKSSPDRLIDIGKDTPTPNAAPTGQGLADNAALQAYRSPTPPGTAALWTVTTN